MNERQSDTALYCIRPLRSGHQDSSPKQAVNEPYKVIDLELPMIDLNVAERGRRFGEVPIPMNERCGTDNDSADLIECGTSLDSGDGIRAL